MVQHTTSGKIWHILGVAGIGGLLGAGGAALDSIVSQALNGEKIDWREVGGSAIDGGIIGAAQAGLLASGAGVPAALLVDFLAGTTGSAAKQYYVDGKIDVGESITRGLTNAVGQLPYNDKIFDKLGKLKNLQGAGREAVKGAMTGAGEAGIRYITDHIGSNPAQVRMGTGLLPAIAGNFSPSELLRDPKRGCGSESPFAPGLGYHSARGYQYDVPRISESKSNKASLGGFLKETALGGLMGGLASAAFYRVGKGIDKLKESVLPKKNAGVRYRIGQPVAKTEKTYEMALDPKTYAYAIIDKYGINLRGSGHNIMIQYNPELPRGTYGRTRRDAPNIIEFGSDALMSEVELANTIAHELNHARDYLRGGIADENPAYAAGDALTDYILGGR